MILHDRGVLNIDETIGKYLPDFPNGDKITLRQLLTHTSGVQEPVPAANDCTPSCEQGSLRLTRAVDHSLYADHRQGQRHVVRG